MRQYQEASKFEREPISWWSWRPGIKPRTAFVVGGLLSLVALGEIVHITYSPHLHYVYALEPVD